MELPQIHACRQLQILQTYPEHMAGGLEESDMFWVACWLLYRSYIHRKMGWYIIFTVEKILIIIMSSDDHHHHHHHSQSSWTSSKSITIVIIISSSGQHYKTSFQWTTSSLSWEKNHDHDHHYDHDACCFRWFLEKRMDGKTTSAFVLGILD